MDQLTQIKQLEQTDRSMFWKKYAQYYYERNDPESMPRVICGVIDDEIDNDFTSDVKLNTIKYIVETYNVIIYDVMLRRSSDIEIVKYLTRYFLSKWDKKYAYSIPSILSGIYRTDSAQLNIYLINLGANVDMIPEQFRHLYISAGASRFFVDYPMYRSNPVVIPYLKRHLAVRQKLSELHITNGLINMIIDYLSYELPELSTEQITHLEYINKILLDKYIELSKNDT